jgi:hypothetical protein
MLVPVSVSAHHHDQDHRHVLSSFRRRDFVKCSEQSLPKWACVLPCPTVAGCLGGRAHPMVTVGEEGLGSHFRHSPRREAALLPQIQRVGP